MPSFVVGITGGIGSGKSTVAKLFAAEGIDYVDADDVAREVVAKGSDGLNAITAHFGHSVLSNDGTLDRATLRQRVFDNPEERTWLEQLTHPLIHQLTQQLLNKATSPYAIYVSPLMTEKGIPAWVKRVAIIDCSESTQIQRVTQRDNNSPELVQSIMAAQASREQRLAIADDVIINEEDATLLKQQVATLHQQYLQQANDYRD